MTWPQHELTSIMRLHALAAAYPNAGIGEITLDAPYDEAWSWLMDLEANVPRWDTSVRRVRRGRSDGRQFRMWAWGRRGPLPWPFRVQIEPGFCIMQGYARTFLVIMAAAPDGEGRTRYAHAEAIPIRGFTRMRGRLQRMVEADLALLRTRMPHSI